MPQSKIKGRGIGHNPSGRYELYTRDANQALKCDQGQSQNFPAIPTQLHIDSSKTIIANNSSPDVPFNRSINPYRGCEHGCVYCFARPSHSWLGFSPGLDFETQIIYKPNAPQLLIEALSKSGYQCESIVIGSNTDAYQPVEKKLGLTRRLLEIFLQCNHPVAIITKSSLIERDIDIIKQLAEKHLVLVHISICTLQKDLSRKLEPRASTPKRRLEIISNLRHNGIPVNLLLAPIIPGLNDHELESILSQARKAGAQSSNYVLLRLPHELKLIFQQWLRENYPLKCDHVVNMLRDCHGGKDYDSDYSQRMSGTGNYAQMLMQRFNLAHKRLAYVCAPCLDCDSFTPPLTSQLNLF